jgi:hypothetical protein
MTQHGESSRRSVKRQKIVEATTPKTTNRNIARVTTTTNSDHDATEETSNRGAGGIPSRAASSRKRKATLPIPTDSNEASSGKKKERKTTRRGTKQKKVAKVELDDTKDGNLDDPCKEAPTLDEWQQQFLNFITYPSDHVVIETGKKVPFTETVMWGRQKELWTLPFLQHQQQRQMRTGKATITWIDTIDATDLDVNNIDAKMREHSVSKFGGSHLSQKLFVQAVIATAQPKVNSAVKRQQEDDVNEGLKAERNASRRTPDLFTEPSELDASTALLQMNGEHLHNTALLIRRNHEQALWYHGGTTMNENLGQWLQQERQSYHLATTESRKFSRKLKGRTASTTLSPYETERGYQKLQQSFHFNLLQLVGIDLKSIRHDETLFHGKYYKK